MAIFYALHGYHFLGTKRHAFYYSCFWLSLESYHGYEAIRPRRMNDEVSLAELKARMAAAHPDRGGTNTDFIAAREAYVQAQRRSRGC